jgi:hypothetical protein
MFFNLSTTHHQPKGTGDGNRRGKLRFPMQRDLRYKLLKDGATVESGAGQTIDLGSGGVGFEIGGRDLPAGSFIELSISWPVLLDASCPMRLIVFGRVVRSANGKSACTIDKYEFRTQSRVVRPMTSRTDTMLQRWADGVRRDAAQNLKLRIMTA